MSRIIVDLNTVLKPNKPYADSTLNNMRKADLIEYIRTLEYNHNVAVATLNQQAENVKDYKPVVHAHWIDNGPDIQCSACGFTCDDEYYLGKRVACPNCGANMDKKEH